jgi:hypothetical protein
MKKEEEQKPKLKHPHKYSKKVVDEILTLIREGKTMDEILEVVQPRRRAIERYARKAGIEIKKS